MKTDEFDVRKVLLSIFKIDLEGKFPCEMSFRRFHPKSEKSVFISPQKTRSRLSSDFFVNLEGVLPLVREEVKNKTVATFYDVYDVSDPIFVLFQLSVRIESY